MTSEEAKELLTHILMTYEPRDRYGDWDDSVPYEEAITMAIEALQQVTGKLNKRDDSLLTADIETCKEQKSKLDLISRRDAIDAIERKAYRHTYLDQIIDIIESLPSADPKREECEEREQGLCPFYAG